MYADSVAPISAGQIAPNIKPHGTSLERILDFIVRQLPKWREDPIRRAVTGEDLLSEQLCDFLNNAARHEGGIDALTFTRESQCGAGRRIDVAVKPRGTFDVAGRSYSYYDTLLPVECKRLPTPEGKDRDEREYVTSEKGSTGGIERFRRGHHGRGHGLVAMIGYLQSGTHRSWLESVNGWIAALKGSFNQLDWSERDRLIEDNYTEGDDVMCCDSMHTRLTDEGEVRIRHLWICMKPS